MSEETGKDPNASQRRFPLAAYNLDSDGFEFFLSVRGTADITGALT